MEMKNAKRMKARKVMRTRLKMILKNKNSMKTATLYYVTKMATQLLLTMTLQKA